MKELDKLKKEIKERTTKKFINRMYSSIPSKADKSKFAVYVNPKYYYGKDKYKEIPIRLSNLIKPKYMFITYDCYM